MPEEFDGVCWAFLLNSINIVESNTFLDRIDESIAVWFVDKNINGDDWTRIQSAREWVEMKRYANRHFLFFIQFNLIEPLIESINR